MARRKLIITDLDPLTSGESNGRAWTLYKVTATDPGGEPIRHELRTFDGGLATFEPIDVEVEPRAGDGQPTYTVRRPRRRQNVELRSQLDEQREMITSLARRVSTLERGRQGSMNV